MGIFLAVVSRYGPDWPAVAFLQWTGMRKVQSHSLRHHAEHGVHTCCPALIPAARGKPAACAALPP